MAEKREFKGIWIPKHIWLNKNLSITEMFLLAEIESYDNDFGCVATNKTLCEDLRITPSTTSSVIKSLEQKGFISVTYRNFHTHEGRKITVVVPPFGIPKPPLEKSEPPLEKSEPSNTFSNTLSSKIDSKLSNAELPSSTSAAPKLSDMDKCQLFIEKFNETKVIGTKKSKYKASQQICGKLKQRLKDYTGNQIIAALNLALKDEYHLKTNLKYVTPEYILRPNILDRFLNTIEGEETNNEKRELVY